MSNYSKIIISPSDPIHFENLCDDKRIKITSQKTDSLFRSFKLSDSSSSKFVRTVSSDPILRTLIFLRGRQIPNLNTKYPLIESYPLIINPEYDLFDTLKSVYKEEKEEAEKGLGELKEEIKDVYSTINQKSIELIYTDDEVVNAIRVRRANKIQDAIENAIKRHEGQIKELFSDYIDSSMDRFHYFQILEDVVEYTTILEIAKENSALIHRAVDLSNRDERLYNSLERLTAENVINLGYECLCLECYYRNKENPYKAEIMNIKNIKLLKECPRCNRDGLVYKLNLGYPEGLHKILLPDAKWLHEAIIGYSLSTVDEIKKIYIHKKIHNIDERGLEGKGVESDISIVTKDKKLVLLEVTTERSLDHIYDNITRKQINLKEKGIPYYSLGYVTPYIARSDEFLTAGDAKIFMAKHIKEIETFVKLNLLS